MARRYWSSLLAIVVTVGNAVADIELETAKITCTHDGFLPHPENCRAFYWCSLRRSSRAIILECDDDQIFDTSTQTCLPPSESTRRECGGTFGLTNEVEVFHEDQIAEENHHNEDYQFRNQFGSFGDLKLRSPAQDDQLNLKISRDLGLQCSEEGFIADEQDCTKFYRCIPNGRGLFQKYSFECGTGTVWDKEISACNHPWATRDARCGTFGSNFNSDISSSASSSASSSSSSSASSSSSSSSVNYYPGSNYEQQNNVHPPIENNYNQQPIDNNYYNNPNVQQPPQYIDPNNPNNIQQPDNNYYNNVQQPPPQYVDQNPNNIQQPSPQIPDYGNNYQQQQQQPPNYIPNNPNIQQPITDNINNVQQTENSNIHPPFNPTGGVDCIQEGFMGDFRDCQKFYRCVPNGRASFMKYEFSCGDGTVWDSELNSCNHIWATRNSNCNNIQNPQNQYPEVQSSTENINGNYPYIPENQYPGNNNQPSAEIPQRPSGNYPPIPENQYPQRPTENYPVPENQYPGNYPINENQPGSQYPGNNNQPPVNYPTIPENQYPQRPTENYPSVPDNQYPGNYPPTNENQPGSQYPGNNNQPPVNYPPIPENQYPQKPTENYPIPPENQYPGNYPINPEYPNQPSNEITQRPPESQYPISNPEMTGENSEAKCIKEDFIPDPKDCTKFFRCVKSGRGFSKYEFSCAEGTVWDRDLKTCNHPENTRRPCGTSTAINTESPRPEIPEPLTTISPESTSENTVTESTVSIGTTSENAVSSSTLSNIDQTSVSSGSETSSSTPLPESTSTNPEKVTETVPNSNSKSTSPEPSNTSSNELSEMSSIRPEVTNTTSENTTETVPQYDVCTSEGFIGDSKNCKKFYRCVTNNQKTFIKYEFTCGPGTIWDGEQNTCNFPQATRRQCSTIEELSTTESSEINKDISTTTSSSDMSSNNSSVSSTTEIIEQSTGSTISEFSTSTQQPNVQPINCTEEGFVPDMNDCKIFYRCVPSGKRFTSYQFTCGEGTVWDSNLQTCNHISEVRNSNCASDTETTGSTEPNTSSTDGSTTVASTDGASSTEQDKNNESTTEQITSVSSTDGSSTIANTESSTDGASSTEQEKNNESTTEQNTSVSSTEGSSTIASTESSTDAGASSTENNESTTPNSEVSSTTIVPDTEQSSSTATVPSETTEQAGSTSTTGAQSSTEVTSTLNPEISTDISSSTISSESTTNVSSSTESSTISAESTTPLNETEPSTTLSSDQSNSSTTQSSQSQPSSTTQQPIETNLLATDICTSEGFFANTRNCNNFYRCVSNGKGYTKYEFSCAPGTIWDPDLDTCNHPYAVRNKKCAQSQQSGTVKPESSTSKPESSTSGSGNGTQTETPSGGSERPQTEASGEICTSVGFYPIRRDCKKFYRCVQNGNIYTKYEFTCGEGTIFDPELQACNHPYATQNRACGHSPDKELPSSSTSTESTTVVDAETTTQELLGETTTDSQATGLTTLNPTTTENINELTTNIIDVTTDIDKQETTTNIDNLTTQQPVGTDLTTEVEKEIPTTTELQQTTITEQEIKSTTPESLETTTQDIAGTTLIATTVDSLTEQTTLDNREITTEVESTTLENKEITTEVESTTLENKEITTVDSLTEQTTLDNREITTEYQSTTPDNREITTELLSTTPDNQEITTDLQSTTLDNREITTEVQTTENPTDNQQTTIETSETTTTSSATTTDMNQLISTTSPIVNQSLPCPISELEGDQISLICPTGFKRHPKYCNLFYQCTNTADSTQIKILVLRCPNGTIYDERKIQCLSPEESAEKCTGEIKEEATFRTTLKSNALPMEIKSKQPLCPKEGIYPLDKTKCLNNYIQCQLSAERQTMRAYMQQCPTGQTYWPISKRCEKQSPILGCAADPTDLSQWMIPVETIRK